MIFKIVTWDLSHGIEGKSVLVIERAGSIGSSFVKSILPFKLDELFIVDTKENALTELIGDLCFNKIFVSPTYLLYPMDYRMHRSCTEI